MNWPLVLACVPLIASGALGLHMYIRWRKGDDES
jgi:hypothetical protein